MRALNYFSLFLVSSSLGFAESPDLESRVGGMLWGALVADAFLGAYHGGDYVPAPWKTRILEAEELGLWINTLAEQATE